MFKKMNANATSNNNLRAFFPGKYENKTPRAFHFLSKWQPPLAYSDREPSFIIVLNRTKNPTPHALLAQNNLIVAPAARSAEEQLLNHATSCIQYPGILVQYAAPPSSPQIPQFSALPSFPYDFSYQGPPAIFG